MAEQTSLRQFIPEPTTSLMSVDGLSGYTQQNPLPVDERDRQEAARELSRRGITAQAPVPSNQSVMAAPTSINPFNPAFRETARSALNDFFGGSNIAGREGYRTGQLVDTAVGAMDFIPGVGDAVGVGDLRQSIGSGDLIGTAVDTTALAAGMIPVVGDAAAKGIKASESTLRNFLPEQFPKDYRPQVVDAYVGQELDPRIFATGARGSPRVKDVEQNLATTVQYGDNRIESIPTVNLEDYEGYAFMSPMADTSGAGDVIQSINDMPVGVPRRGGIDFMNDPASGDFVWSSDRSKILGRETPGTFIGISRKLQELTPGKEPLFLPHSMTPTGVDYSQVSEVMLSHAKNNLDQSTIRSLDKDIKEIYPDWLGLDTEGAINDLNRVSGEYRKKIINLIDKDYAKQGAINAGQARLALIDEGQRFLRPGTVLNMGAIDISRMPVTGDVHPVYDTGLYGEGRGRLSVPLSVYELNPQAAYLSGIRPDQLMSPPRQSGQQGGLRSLEGSPLTGIITEDVLRGIEARRAQ